MCRVCKMQCAGLHCIKLWHYPGHGDYGDIGTNSIHFRQQLSCYITPARHRSLGGHRYPEHSTLCKEQVMFDVSLESFYCSWQDYTETNVAARMPDIRKSISPNKEFDKNELRERLTPIQYQVTQEHHTEKWVRIYNQVQFIITIWPQKYWNMKKQIRNSQMRTKIKTNWL